MGNSFTCSSAQKAGYLPLYCPRTKSTTDIKSVVLKLGGHRPLSFLTPRTILMATAGRTSPIIGDRAWRKRCAPPTAVPTDSGSLPVQAFADGGERPEIHAHPRVGSSRRSSTSAGPAGQVGDRRVSLPDVRVKQPISLDQARVWQPRKPRLTWRYKLS